MIKISRLSQAVVLGAASNWRLSVVQLQRVLDQAIADAATTPNASDREAFRDALVALYDLEAAIFGPVDVDLPVPDDAMSAVAPGVTAGPQPSFQADQPPA